MLFILFRRTRNNWTSHGTIFVMQFTRVCCVFRERERDELFVVSCTLHPWTLTPRCPVQPAGPSVSDTVIHNVCRPGMTLLNVLLDGKISFRSCSSSSSVFLIFFFFFLFSGPRTKVDFEDCPSFFSCSCSCSCSSKQRSLSCLSILFRFLKSSLDFSFPSIAKAAFEKGGWTKSD